MNTIVRIIFISLLIASASPLISAERSETPEMCTYDVRIWNTDAGKVTRTLKVKKNYSDLTEKERDRSGTGCTVCSEDQTMITLPGISSFSACHIIADKVESALRELIAQGEPVLSVSGYRPVRSKGALNADGERTELSNHAFGTAIDINRMQNGLYNNCYEWGPACELALGGPWRPGEIKGSLSPDGVIVRKMKSLGFKWGGEIKSSQKDFMHFSLSGF